MLIVVEQYDTQEVYVKSELVNADGMGILSYIMTEAQEYDTIERLAEIRDSYINWIYRVTNTSVNDTMDRHFRVDMYQDSTRLETYRKSIIVYYHYN